MHNRRLIYFCVSPLFFFSFDLFQSVFIHLFTTSVSILLLISHMHGGQFQLNVALSCAANLERNPSWCRTNVPLNKQFLKTE